LQLLVRIKQIKHDLELIASQLAASFCSYKLAAVLDLDTHDLGNSNNEVCCFGIALFHTQHKNINVGEDHHLRHYTGSFII